MQSFRSLTKTEVDHTGTRRAQAWLDRELRRDPAYDPDTPEANLTTSGAVEFEQALRNGVALAKLARVFDGKEAVPRIYTVRSSSLVGTLLPSFTCLHATGSQACVCPY